MEQELRQGVAAALIMVLTVFFLPALVVRGQPLYGGESEGGQAGTQENQAAQSAQPAASRDRGRAVRLQMEDGTIQEMTMADYLWGVVAAEMPASFEEEALKAQACAARTYTVIKQNSASQKHPGADICADSTCCQAYVERDAALLRWGLSAQENEEKITRAVEGTDGLGILYQGEPIQALFFSSAAGRTVDAVEVWGNAVPYLTSVDSPEGDEVPNYHSTVTVPLDEFKSKLLAQYPQADLSGEPAGWFANLVPNSAGGVETVDIGGVTVGGGSLRTLFGLRSTSFTVSASADGVTFSVTGYGHGVGMSQYGANALAKEGKSYDEILKWYYTGIDVAPYTPQR